MRDRLNALLSVVLLLGIAVALNALGARHYARLDLSSRHANSLREETVHLLRDLSRVPEKARRRFERLDANGDGVVTKEEFDASPDAFRRLDRNGDGDLRLEELRPTSPVTIRAYLSRRWPAYRIRLRRDVTDLLDEFEAESRGRLRVEYLDPGESDELRDRAARLGIIRWQAGAVSREKTEAEVRLVYSGLAILYKGKKPEVIPNVRNSRDLEADLALLIRRVTQPERSRIAFVSDHGGVAAKGGCGVLRRELATLYDVEDLALKSVAEVPARLDTVLLVAPQEPLSARALFELDQFVMAGGKLLVIGPRHIVRQSGVVPLKVGGLPGVLRAYGLIYGDDLVFDPTSGIVKFVRIGNAIRGMRYPYWMNLAGSHSPESPIADARARYIVQDAASVEPAAELPAGVHGARLLLTSKDSWTQTKPTRFIPSLPPDMVRGWSPRQRHEVAARQFHAPPPQARHPVSIMAAVSGALPSAFRGRETPPPPKGKKDPLAKRKNTGRDGGVLVCGFATLALDQLLSDPRGQADLALCLSAIDWLTLGSSFGAIRTGDVTPPLPDDISGNWRLFTYLVPMLFMSLLVVGVTLGRHAYRRVRERRAMVGRETPVAVAAPRTAPATATATTEEAEG